jgi:HEAT repeat protein
MIYEFRDEETISYCESLLKTMGIIINRHHAHLTIDTSAAIAESLTNAWDQEVKRHALPLPLRLISSEILGNTLLTLATYFANDNFTDFLIEEVIEQGDPENEDRASISPLTQTAVEALLKSHSQKNLQRLLDLIIDDVEDYSLSLENKASREIQQWRYNVIWIVGEVAYRQPALLQTEDMVVDFISALKTILKVSKKWQHAVHAAEALGKIGTILDQNQVSQVIHSLKDSLLGKHNRLIIGIDKIQESAALALGEIGVKKPEVFNEILDTLIERRTEFDYEVRCAILKAIGRLGKVADSEQIPRIFEVCIEFLSDCNHKAKTPNAIVRKKAAQVLQGLIQKYSDYAATKLQKVIEAARQVLNGPSDGRIWDKARVAVVWTLNDIALAVSDRQRQAVIKIIKEYINDSSENVQDAAEEALKVIMEFRL